MKEQTILEIVIDVLSGLFLVSITRDRNISKKEAKKIISNPAANLTDDLGIDSLGRMELILDLEDAFGEEIPDQEIANFRTVWDIANFFEPKTYHA